MSFDDAVQDILRGRTAKPVNPRLPWWQQGGPVMDALHESFSDIEKVEFDVNKITPRELSFFCAAGDSRADFTLRNGRLSSREDKFLFSYEGKITCVEDLVEALNNYQRKLVRWNEYH